MNTLLLLRKLLFYKVVGQLEDESLAKYTPKINLKNVIHIQTRTVNFKKEHFYSNVITYSEL